MSLGAYSVEQGTCSHDPLPSQTGLDPLLDALLIEQPARLPLADELLVHFHEIILLSVVDYVVLVLKKTCRSSEPTLSSYNSS